ncbi:hypothetical protein C8F01DRAFT_668505 [Mycena amicta]|nr:hypothetical protein C8F01DRAFT_668505 [Mycena amicta]
MQWTRAGSSPTPTSCSNWDVMCSFSRIAGSPTLKAFPLNDVSSNTAERISRWNSRYRSRFGCSSHPQFHDSGRGAFFCPNRQFSLCRDGDLIVIQILFGFSLGGAVAIDLARRNPSKIAALILENTFLSIPLLVRDWEYIGPFSFLCTERWNSAARISKIPSATAMLFLSGTSDRVVPRKHMQRLWEIAQKRHQDRKGKGKAEPALDRFQAFKWGGHANTSECIGYWDTIRRFIDSVTI